jgi:hypothetical protein
LSLFGYSNVVDNGNYAKIDFAMQTSGTGGNVVASIRGLADGTGENASDLVFYTATGGALNPQMTIDSSGNVGIGTTSPSFKLDVAGDIALSNDLYVSNGNFIKLQRNSGGLYLDVLGTPSGTDDVRLLSSGDFNFVNGSLTNLLTIKNGGNVGIGTNTVLGSATRLHVKVDDSNTDFSLGSPYHLLIENDNTTTNTGAMLGLRADTADGGIALHYGGSQNVGYMTFHVDAGGGANGERMRIDSSGNVLIGKTASSGVATGNIEVSNSSSASVQIEGGTHEWSMLVSSAADALRFFQDSTERMRIDSSGNVGIGTTSPGTKLEVNGTATVTSLVETSTRKLKENIETLEDQSSIVDSLQPVSYTWKESKEEDFGLVAEDVAEIAPHLVSRDEDGNPTGIKYSKLSVLLLDVVQRQSTLIEDLNERITKLENERGN